MADTLPPDRRSWNMRRITSANTKPELIVRSMLHRAGYRFRLHERNLPGKPDIVLKKYKSAIFVNGCFWHQHPGCKRATKPKSNQEYWLPKLERNKVRFLEVTQELEARGWNVIVIWECETKDFELLFVNIDEKLKRG